LGICKSWGGGWKKYRSRNNAKEGVRGEGNAVKEDVGNRGNKKGKVDSGQWSGGKRVREARKEFKRKGKL